MGLSEEEQKQSQELRLQPNGESSHVERNNTKVTERPSNEVSATHRESQFEVTSCCQEKGNDDTCCKTPLLTERKLDMFDNERAVKLKPEMKCTNAKILIGKGGSSTRKTCAAMPTWFESWEREDTYAALAVVSAALSVAFAFKCYKQLR